MGRCGSITASLPRAVLHTSTPLEGRLGHAAPDRPGASSNFSEGQAFQTRPEGSWRYEFLFLQAVEGDDVAFEEGV
jgi:hypothetical protein